MKKHFSQAEAWVKTPNEILSRLISAKGSFYLADKQIESIVNSISPSDSSVVYLLDNVYDDSIYPALPEVLRPETDYSRAVREELAIVLLKLRAKITSNLRSEGLDVFQLQQNQFNLFDPCLATYPRWSRLSGKEGYFAKANFSTRFSPFELEESISRHFADEQVFYSSSLDKSASILKQSENQFLLKPNLSELTIETKRNLMKDIAQALTQLHSRGIVHLALNLDNILIQKNNSAKDKVIYSALLLEQAKLAKINEQQTFIENNKFCAETLLTEKFIYNTTSNSDLTKKSEKSFIDFENNIFSFGIISLQAVCGVKLVDQIRIKFESAPASPKLREQILFGIVDENIKSTHPMSRIIKNCLVANRKNRPSAEDLFCLLEDLSQNSIVK